MVAFSAMEIEEHSLRQNQWSHSRLMSKNLSRDGSVVIPGPVSRNSHRGPVHLSGRRSSPINGIRISPGESKNVCHQVQLCACEDIRCPPRATTVTQVNGISFGPWR